MVNRRKTKYSVGEASQFMSRKGALKKLQLSLKDFRKLCILKGIYPREPRNRKRAQKGETGIKTLYHKKDIQFLLHEPIVWKMRDYNIFCKKVGRARALKDFRSMNRYLNNHPTLKLDHIVKERYPTFVDALRDVDDCLTLCFLFSTFPSIKHVPRNQSMLCRRLTVEFMHAVIEAKALRKVFVSIKGYYYQAELNGITINWIVPHHFSFVPQSKNEVDFKIMATFVEFYTVMLGFINFRLYHDQNLFYPPKFKNVETVESNLVDEESYVAERVAALNVQLAKTSNDNEDEEIQIDAFSTDGDPEKIIEAKKEAEQIKKLKTLFKGLKFFINREVPREPLVFIIRCFGGEVSWDKSSFVGSTFAESDETITHQIVDRPNMEKQFLSRYYIQPQWIFDSVNNRMLLPESKYLMGVVLPPHLSPFFDEVRTEKYVPPEEQTIKDPTLIENVQSEDEVSESDNEQNNSEVDNDIESETENNEESEDQESEDGDIDLNHLQSTGQVKAPELIVEDDKELARQRMLQKMAVKKGEIFKENPWEKNQIERQEYKLREKMIAKKHRKLYKSMMEGRRKRSKEIWLLKKKRRIIEEDKKETKKVKKVKAAK